MKRKLFLIAFALSAANCFAQGAQGSVSIIPRLGTCISNVTGYEISFGLDGNTYKSRNKAGFMAGVDVEYMMKDNISMTIGAYYAMQGSRFPDFKQKISDDKYHGFSRYHTDMEYINVPVVFNYYVIPGLAFKTGCQVAYLLSSKESYEMTPFSVDENGKKSYEETEKTEKDLKKTKRRYDVSLPIGVSYEYNNVIIDARYNIGFYNINNKKLNILKNQNRFFTLTVGYRFNML